MICKFTKFKIGDEVIAIDSGIINDLGSEPLTIERMRLICDKTGVSYSLDPVVHGKEHGIECGTYYLGFKNVSILYDAAYFEHCRKISKKCRDDNASLWDKLAE